jgi:hypothetical protein
MFRALVQYVSRFVEYTGGWSIIALDGILLIPLAFAMFFLPGVVLLLLAVAVFVGVAAYAAERAWHSRTHTH